MNIFETDNTPTPIDDPEFMVYSKREASPDETDLAQRPGYKILVTEIKTTPSRIIITEYPPHRTILAVPIYSIEVEGQPDFKVPAFEAQDILPRIAMLLREGHTIHPDSQALYDKLSGYQLSAPATPIEESPKHRKSKVTEDPMAPAKPKRAKTKNKPRATGGEQAFKLVDQDGTIIVEGSTRKSFRKLLRQAGYSIRTITKIDDQTYTA